MVPEDNGGGTRNGNIPAGGMTALLLLLLFPGCCVKICVWSCWMTDIKIICCCCRVESVDSKAFGTPGAGVPSSSSSELELDSVCK